MVHTTKEAFMKVIIGIDPHKASHTAVAICRDEDQIARSRCVPRSARRPALGLGRTLREANLGHRVGRWAGLPAGPTAGRPWRGCARCPRHAGLTDPGAGHGSLQQERPQRCPLDRHRRPAGTKLAVATGRGA